MHLTTSLSRAGAFTLLFAGAASLSTLTACSGGAGAGSTADDGAPKIVGVYTAQSEGPIHEIAFESDSTYMLSSTECGSAPAPCATTGTFTVNASDTQVELTDAATGRTTTLPLTVLTTGDFGASAKSEEITRVDDLVSPADGGLVSASDGGIVTDGGSLVDAGDGGLVSASDAGIVTDGGSLVIPGDGGLTSCTGSCAVEIQLNGQTLVYSS